MANYTLASDTDLSAIPGLSNGWDIGLGGHVLTVSTDMRSVTGLKASGTGTIRLVSGGAADFTGFRNTTIPATITIEGGTAENPLPAHRDAANIADNFPLRSSACMIVGQSCTIEGRVVSHSFTNADRPQYSAIASATATTLTLVDDVALEPGDVVGILFTSVEPNTAPAQVSAYDPQTKTATLSASLSTIPDSSCGCILFTSAFAIAQNPGDSNVCFGRMSEVRGDELGVQWGRYWNASAFNGSVFLRRLVFSSLTFPHNLCVLGDCDIRCGIYASNCGNGSSNSSSRYTAHLDLAYSGSLFSGYYTKNEHAIFGRGIKVGGGRVAAFGIEPYGAAEFVDCELPNPLYSQLRDTSELVVRTTSPETCVIHRAGGIATLVRKGGGDVVMAQSTVASAYQLAPTGAEAVWHDQAVTVEAGARLTVAWRAFCSIGAIGGIQILADSPLFGQVAVPMGAADVLAEHAESSPSPGEWGPSRLLSWRNTSGQPVRVWVRGWGQGGTVYSSAQVVKGGAL